MSVVKSKRKETRFEVFSNFSKLRSGLTEFMYHDFGYKKPVYKEGGSDEQKKEAEKRHAFCMWFIDKEREKILSILMEITRYNTMANSIYPNHIFECDEQREFQNISIGLCYDLLQEFQYVIEVVHMDINKFTTHVERIEREIALLKGWRSYGNAIRKKVGGASSENKMSGQR